MDTGGSAHFHVTCQLNSTVGILHYVESCLWMVGSIFPARLVMSAVFFTDHLRQHAFKVYHCTQWNMPAFSAFVHV